MLAEVMAGIVCTGGAAGTADGVLGVREPATMVLSGYAVPLRVMTPAAWAFPPIRAFPVTAHLLVKLAVPVTMRSPSIRESVVQVKFPPVHRPSIVQTFVIDAPSTALTGPRICALELHSNLPLVCAPPSMISKLLVVVKSPALKTPYPKSGGVRTGSIRLSSSWTTFLTSTGPSPLRVVMEARDVKVAPVRSTPEATGQVAAAAPSDR